jgi:hypothetical protein
MPGQATTHTGRAEGSQSLHNYLKDYQSLVQVLEHYGAALSAEGPYLDALKEMSESDSTN